MCVGMSRNEPKHQQLEPRVHLMQKKSQSILTTIKNRRDFSKGYHVTLKVRSNETGRKSSKHVIYSGIYRGIKGKFEKITDNS